MGIFTEIRNEALIRELERELNTDIVLFGFDGFTYFGNLQGIEDGRIGILSPAIKASTSDVEILTPGGDIQLVGFARVDLWQIVGKATGIVHDPIESSPHPLHIGGPPMPGTPREPEDTVGRQESHNLIHQLRRMVGDEVVITTLGGFLFEGLLAEVECELALLKVDDIFVPGDTTAISDSRVRSAVVNLEAVTSVSGATS